MVPAADMDAAAKELKELGTTTQAGAAKAHEVQHPAQAREDSGIGAWAGSKDSFRTSLTGTLERRLFYIPSFKIYGSVAGFYDYGPPGCGIKQNLTQCWRQHFVVEESMLELECPAVTPEPVLKASGHVDRFTDFMVRDERTGDCYRADHLLEAKLEAVLADKKNPLDDEEQKDVRDTLARVGELDQHQMDAALKRFDVKAPDTKNDLSSPFPFNLMFKTSIGPRGDMAGFLRPETAQGIFVNFRELLYYNGGKLPFAAAQIGNSYRNEISPRAGLLRVREFTQAEIEHFVSPDNKQHARFKNVAHLTPLLFSRELQVSLEKKAKQLSLGDAVNKGIIANETLAYFIGRTFLFFQKAGINPARMRFRQHLEHEMAHYAEDCWDAEVETTYGWVECAGLADRSAYDLRAHSTSSGIELAAYEKFAEPRTVEVTRITFNKKELGLAFKKDQKLVVAALEKLSEEDLNCMQRSFEEGKEGTVTVDGRLFTITTAMVSIKRQPEKLSGRTFIPSVIEPSFGIGRIIYCIFEHSYYVRQGEGNEARAVFRFTSVIAPTKASVLPLMQKESMNEVATTIAASLTAAGLSTIIDTTGTAIGRRYARTDEIGVPYAVTVDFDTLEKQTVTLRERDSMAQIRLPISDVSHVLRNLVDVKICWRDLTDKYPAQQTPADT